MLSLVVDDDPAVRSFVQVILQRESFETLEADGGNQALEILERLGGALDLVICDIRMPEGDGVTFARAVRARFPGVPIILISGEPKPDEIFEFVEKPFRWATLMSAVRKVTGAAAGRGLSRH